MITLRNKETGEFIGNITEEQLKFLTSEMEEESHADRDFWIDASELEFLKEDGADPGLLGLLEKAIGGREGIEIEWEKK
jgi:hypothetical protein